MKQTCKEKEHTHKPLLYVCTSSKCKANRLLCFRCLGTQHKECWNYILEIEDISKRNLPENINWIKNGYIKQALSSVQEYERFSPKDQLFISLEEMIEREFSKVVIYFSGKVQEIKQKVIDNVKERLFNEDISLKDFEDQLRRLCNFDALLGLLDFYNIGENDLRTVSNEVATFFKDADLTGVANKGLSEIASKINSLTQNLLEMNQNVFAKLKDSMALDILNPNDDDETELIEFNKSWTWDATNKSEEIDLSEDCLIAAKTAYYSGTKRALIGNKPLTEGHFRWEIDLAGSTPHRPCFVHFAGYNTVFGIIESHLIHDVENPSLTNVMGLSLGGKAYNMKEVSKVSNYRDKSYMFDLDLKRGRFTISADGRVLCEEVNVQGKVFLPVVVLYCVHDRINLTVMPDGI